VAPARTLFLVGFMGSGKSTVGACLAARLDRKIVDTDQRVVEREGRSIERIFAESGEDYFRRAETDVLCDIRADAPLVVATGGGLFLGAEQRRLMKDRGVTVWLDVDAATVRRRVGDGRGRPLWPTEDPVEFRAFFERRRAVYALADFRVPAGSQDPHAIAATVLSRAAIAAGPDCAATGPPP
jgi:shikimate kinase